MKSQRLPDAEYEIMDLVWASEPPVTTAQAYERIGREKGVKMQTIVTLFGRLVARGFLRFERGKGRERDFYPLISREEYLQMETDGFMARYHRDSVASLIATLHPARLTRDDLDELDAWLDEARKRIDAQEGPQED